MSIYLGNLDVSKIEERCGIRLTSEDKTALSSCWQRKASDVEAGKWHCFDVPFCIVCRDMDTAITVYHILNKYEEQIQEPMDICIRETEEEWEYEYFKPFNNV